MVEALSSEQFYQSPGVQDWHVATSSASATFITGTFERGLNLVNVVGALAKVADHHPDIDLRYSSVLIRLTTHEIHALTLRDVNLAKDISTAARGLGFASTPLRRPPNGCSSDATSE